MATAEAPQSLTTAKDLDGGHYKPNFRLEDLLVIARPSERNLPSTEPQEINFKGALDTEKYLADVTRLQRIFNRRLGVRVDEKGAILNYNPVLERAVYEHLQTKEQKAQFRQYEDTQLDKVLRERYNVATSTVIYDIDGNGKLRSRDLPNQTFEDVLIIGIEYYKQLRSPDVSRMQQDRVGFIKIQEVFADPDTPTNSKVEVVSGPSSVKGTIFKDNFVDRYLLLEDSLTKKRYVQMTRFASDASYEQYEERITKSRPDYFEAASGPKDEWFLFHPIFGNKEEILIQRKTALKEEDFQKIVQESLEYKQHLIEAICEEIFTPEKIRIRLNALLNGADWAWEKITGIKDRITKSISQIASRVMPLLKTVEEKIDWLGHQAVRAVAAACGLSAGFSIGGIVKSSIGGLISGVRGIFGGFFKDKDYCINCGACGAKIEQVIRRGQKCPRCFATREC